ncbi:AI-2E family transporter [Sandaracinobacteroides hominis]|uniref:AI-2E family transporter n=1 Tax=Sandaracinobacteroides hominis TaxID=2780086 RepID=UPI0018F652EA|nr:AI-2E family transporter [Sandaracinobacteroides hominis]
MAAESGKYPSDGTIFRRTMVVAAAVGSAVMLWRLTDLILLLMAAALVAFIFYKFAAQLQRRIHVPFPVALVLAVLLPAIFLALVFWAFGSMMLDQFALLAQQLPGAFAWAQEWLKTSSLGREITQAAGGFIPDGSRIVSLLQLIASSVGTVVTSLVVVVVAGIYLAAQPRLYGRGVLHLVPPHARDKTVATVGAVAHALSSWLKAQGLSMVFVGIFTGVALSFVGIPAAPAIGMVAGICEFVPYLGTIVVAIPSIIIGFSISTDTGILTVIVIVAVQQIQGNIVTPLIQSKMAELPPALTIFSLIAAGVLLGPMGVILAVPLTVIGQTLVKELLAYPELPEEGAGSLSSLPGDPKQEMLDPTPPPPARPKRRRASKQPPSA